ncbi:unnamed protein product [Dovyalis caffra]|uniref:Beta-fructofuranosidase n=1 Tax=Dovyalis caffra TaxID=77055 RepID=A0AAV1SK15_9ROSI|nr:unnamed protein product [Dovyalis caffra]
MEISAFWVVGICFLLVDHGVHASHNTNRNLQATYQPYRTAYHFQPPKNWMNDPNGPMYHKGLYHLFYQYNPYGAVWGNITWAHSVSYDLVNWVHIDHAISPSQPSDINGCWSGSTTILPGEKPTILYTGIGTKNRQVQNLAMPKNLSDPLLREWIKSPYNPLMTPIDGIDPDFFRDPTTAWQGPDKIWRVIVGSQINGHGTAILYRSKDFVNWTRSDNPLHSSVKTEMWECPDFFPVGISSTNGVDTSSQDKYTKHVLKASFNHHDYYILGSYMPEKDKFSVETDFMDSTGMDLRYDYGKFYASKTFFDSAMKRRILWGWINESDSESDDIKKGWSGLQSGRLKKSRNYGPRTVSFHAKKLKSGSTIEVPGITASQADVEVSFELLNLEEAELMDPSWTDPQLLCSQKKASVRGKLGPFGLLVFATKDLTEQTAIYFRIFRRKDKYIVLMCSDQSRSSVREGLDKTTYGAFIDMDPRHENITLRSLIDHSIVESFGGEGRACITARVYPKLAIHKQAYLFAFNHGTSHVKISRLNAWTMENAQIVSTKKRRKPHV